MVIKVLAFQVQSVVVWTPVRSGRTRRWLVTTVLRRVTVRNLKIVKVDLEKNVVLIRGSVPGPNGGLVNIRQS